MKKGLIALTVFLLVGALALFGCTQNTSAAESEYGSLAGDETYGAVGALADDSLSLEEMLSYAIQDEYLAHAEYEYILDTFGDQTPFSNIILAEEQHIETLIGLYETYDLTVPEDTGAEHVVVPASVTEALETGVQAEIDNIAMYEKFLEEDLPDDVRTVFTALMEASEQHLAAFQTALDNRNSSNSDCTGDGTMQQVQASQGTGEDNGTAQQVQTSLRTRQSEDVTECTCTDCEPQSQFQYAYGRDAE